MTSIKASDEVSASNAQGELPHGGMDEVKRGLRRTEMFVKFKQQK
jgi:hypothetical protein